MPVDVQGVAGGRVIQDGTDGVQVQRGGGAARSMPTYDDGTTPTLVTEKPPAVAMQGGYVVRRLTPRECERLQGMPDDHTRIPWRGKPAEECPDGPRYKAIGNSMAVPVMRWIGERLQEVDAVMREMGLF